MPDSSKTKKTASGLTTAVGSEWLPIATAPTDGTDIIVGFDAATVWIVHLAWWRELEEWMIAMPEEWGEDDIGWWSYTQGSVGQEKLEGNRLPTHWMPCPSLPNIPVSETARDEGH